MYDFLFSERDPADRERETTMSTVEFTNQFQIEVHAVFRTFLINNS